MNTLATKIVAPVMEVFPSIQGEGAYVGELQVFLRLAGCPMRCRWCDTPASWTLRATPSARVAARTGARREPAWASPFQAACWVAEAEPESPRTVSVTGGEPLVWHDFLLALRKMLGERPMHLETGGGHPRTLARVMDAFRHVSLDLKLPADLDPPLELGGPFEDGGRPTDERAPRDAGEWSVARKASLDLVAGHDACAKIVVSGGHALREYEVLLEDVQAHAPHVPVYVQPVTPVGGVRPPTPAEVVDVAERARDLELDVRVIPQVHRVLGIP